MLVGGADLLANHVLHNPLPHRAQSEHKKKRKRRSKTEHKLASWRARRSTNIWMCARCGQQGKRRNQNRQDARTAAKIKNTDRKEKLRGRLHGGKRDGRAWWGG
jgi:hypothetical protein